MKRSTLSQVQRNHRNLSIEKIGYGTYRLSCDYRGKRIFAKSHDSVSVDLYNSDPHERHQRQNSMALGYNSLVWQIIRDNRP